jgi:hypothetical protein
LKALYIHQLQRTRCKIPFRWKRENRNHGNEKGCFEEEGDQEGRKEKEVVSGNETNKDRGRESVP